MSPREGGNPGQKTSTAPLARIVRLIMRFGKPDPQRRHNRRWDLSSTPGWWLTDLLYLLFLCAPATSSTQEAAPPDNTLSDEQIGSAFWDGMYPIWTNDSAKVPYFRDFIQRFSHSDWAIYARRNLIATHIALKDMASALAEADSLIRLHFDNPLVLHQVASALFDIPQALSRVNDWAERAYMARDHLARPSYYSPPEWLLVEQAVRAGFPLLLANLYLTPNPKLQNPKSAEARRLAEESLALAVYDVDDHNTASPQHLVLGRIALAEGDSAQCAFHWVEAARLGDVHNRFAGRAVDSLKAVFHLKDEVELLAFCRKVANYRGIIFQRVTAKVGLDSARGSRVAWGDYDGDGDDDLLAGGRRLYANANANADAMQFRNLTESAGLDAEGCHGGIWGDYDNDGNLDLFTFSSSGDTANSERLFRNTGIRSADSLALTFALALADSFSTEAAIWFDANGDGRLDLYIPGYERPAKGADDLGNAWPSRLMVQDADGAFHDSTEDYGLVPKDGKWLCGRSPVACDFDRDGDQDLYVGNYRLQRNQLFVNGQWKMEDGIEDDEFPIPYAIFHDFADSFGVAGVEVEGWWGHTIGCQWADFDGDGDFDLIACNLAHPRYIGFSNRTMLYRNNANANANVDSKFTNVRKQWGIKYEECHSEPVFGDFDNDGDLDLFITCVYPNRRSFLYENKGDHFEDITFLAGVRIFNGWGCATADYDNDGRLDLAACEGGKVELFHNSTTETGNWIEIAASPHVYSPFTQIGAIVEVRTESRTIVRQIEGGKGAGSQNSLTLHFGVGKAEKVKVDFYNYGKSVGFDAVPVNQRYVGIEDLRRSAKQH